MTFSLSSTFSKVSDLFFDDLTGHQKFGKLGTAFGAAAASAYYIATNTTDGFLQNLAAGVAGGFTGSLLIVPMQVAALQDRFKGLAKNYALTALGYGAGAGAVVAVAAVTGIQKFTMS